VGNRRHSRRCMVVVWQCVRQLTFFPPNFQNGQYFVPLLKYILVCINAQTHALLRSNDAPPGALPPLTLHYACRFCVQTGKILPSLYYCNILYCAHNNNNVNRPGSLLLQWKLRLHSSPRTRGDAPATLTMDGNFRYCTFIIFFLKRFRK